MKMISAGAAAANQYSAYVYNCTRNPACESGYSAPLPSVSALQLYADFGATQPSSLEFTFIDTCNNSTEQIFPGEFVVGQTPELNWYGVFRNFSVPAAAYTAFVVHLSANGAMSFFSQMLSTEPCGVLMKIHSCHPELATTTGFDVNGVYYGLPDGASAGSEITYTHIAYVRMGKVRELNDKATFKSNLYFNSRTTVEKIHQIQTEIVPKWYKDVLLAVYSRGMVKINDGQTYLVSDLNFEALNDDDLQWKPQAQLKETFRLFFGCDTFCVQDSQDVGGDGSEPDESGSEPPPPGPCIAWINDNEFDITISYIDCNGNLITGVTLTPTSEVCAREITAQDEGTILNSGFCGDLGVINISAGSGGVINSVTGITHNATLPVGPSAVAPGVWSGFAAGGTINVTVSGGNSGTIQVLYNFVLQATEAHNGAETVAVALPACGAGTEISINVTFV